MAVRHAGATEAQSGPVLAMAPRQRPRTMASDVVFETRRAICGLAKVASAGPSCPDPGTSGDRPQPAEPVRSLRGRQARRGGRWPLSPMERSLEHVDIVRDWSAVIFEESGQTLGLEDGRTLGYAEWGDPSGVPLVHFHGSSSSRLERPLRAGSDGSAWEARLLTLPWREIIRHLTDASGR